MPAFTRAMIPVVALGVGTWIGLGRPDARTAIAAGTRAAPSAGLATDPAAAGDARPPRVPPLEREPRTVDTSRLPDPAPSFPHLNPEQSVERAWLLSEGPAHPPGDGRRLVTFTFDDGPSPETAPLLLRILEQHKIHATFFFIGGYLEGSGRRAAETRECAARIAAAGHRIGNHTFDHKVLTGLSHAAALSEIDDSAAAIEGATGSRPWLFRPPYGIADEWLEHSMRNRHLELVLWNIDVEDMKRDDPDAILRSLEGQLEYKQGGIVLLHDVHAPSVKAFSRLVRWLEQSPWDPNHPQRRGWDIVDLAEYVHATADAPQPFATREELEKARKELDRTRREQQRI